MAGEVVFVPETVVPAVVLALLASLAPAVPAQGKTTGSDTTKAVPEPDALALLATAEALHKEGKDEEASSILREVALKLEATPESVMRSNLEKVVQELLQKADPTEARRREAFQLAAAEFVKLSDSYKRRRWYRMALLALRDAERLDPSTAVAPLTDLQKKGASAFAWEEAHRQARDAKPAAATRPEPQDRLSAFPAGAEGWKSTPTLLTTPVPVDGSSHRLLTARLRHKDGTVSIEARRTDTKGQVQLLFGARSYDDYFILSVDYHGGGSTCLGVFYWSEGKLTHLAFSNFFDLKKEVREGWLRYGVRISGKKVTCFVGEEDRVTVDCPREPHGRIGVAVAQASTGQVQFRKLHAEPPPKPDPKPEREKSAAEQLMAQVAKAEQLMKSRKSADKEEAVVTLVEAGRLGKSLGDDTVGKTVRASIQQLLIKANQPHGDHEKTRRAAAEAILVLADAYSKQGWHKTARSLLLEVRHLDGDVAAPALQANSKLLEPILAKERGLPPEKQGPADNAVLVKWFKGGREPWDADRAWTVDEAGAQAPIDRVGEALILSNEDLGKKAAVTIQVKTSRKRCTAGIAFALKNMNSYYLLVWTHAPEKNRTSMQLYRNQGRDYKRLGPTKTLRFSPEAREQWMTLKLKYGDKKVGFQLGETPEVVVPLDDKYLSGKLALYTYVDETRQQVCFRNLVIQ